MTTYWRSFVYEQLTNHVASQLSSQPVILQFIHQDGILSSLINHIIIWSIICFKATGKFLVVVYRWSDASVGGPLEQCSSCGTDSWVKCYRFFPDLPAGVLLSSLILSYYTENTPVSVSRRGTGGYWAGTGLDRTCKTKVIYAIPKLDMLN